MVFAVIDGHLTYQWGPSAIVAVIAIAMVFLILLTIIGITFGVFKGIELFKKDSNSQNNNPTSSSEVKFDEKNEDMVAAVMVATIEYQSEVKEDVKLVNIKEIK